MNEDFLIRPAVEDDQAFLWDMLYLAIYIPEGQRRPPRSILETPQLACYAREWGRWPGDRGFIAVERATGRSVGAAWLRLFPPEEKGYAYIDERTPELSIALLPEYRGRGLGSALLQALLEDASRDHEAVSLSVGKGNPAARLYRRLGFSVVMEDAANETMVKRLK